MSLAECGPMILGHADDPAYVVGRSEGEARRLERQAELFELPTRRLFEAAGISSGMKVLDLGSGAGDVAFLAAEMVGSTGRVVGVDLDPAVVAHARARARAAGLTQVSFIAGDVREVELPRDFDAVVGRFVLMYLADPVAGMRAALSALRDWIERFEAAYGANLLRSLLPLMLRYGVATEEELGLETFERRYRQEVLSQGSVVQWLPCVGAWARKRPAA